MKANTVWVVEKGSYSDYSVVGVFSTRVNAESTADALNADESWLHDKATVAEWPLDPSVDERRKGYHRFIVHMLADGSTERCEQAAISAYDIGGSCEVWRRSTAPAYAGRGIKDCLMATVWARDAKHAVKIVNEKRAQFVANGQLT